MAGTAGMAHMALSKVLAPQRMTQGNPGHGREGEGEGEGQGQGQYQGDFNSGLFAL
ncbi:MAG: hypothetical protein ACKVQK_10410 [Burkholderiales bacterium]